VASAGAETAPARVVSGGHPGLSLYAPQEIRSGGDAAENGAHMPLGGNARRYWGMALSNHDAEAPFRLEDAETVVAHCEMPRIVEPACRLEEPAMERQQHVRGGLEVAGAGRDQFLGRRANARLDYGCAAYGCEASRQRWG
jgi:hypothetical protein